MKKFILIALALVSVSAFAVECETEVSLSADTTEVVIELTEKAKAAPDSEMFENLFGFKREQSDCKDLELLLEARDMKTELDGVETAVRIVNLSEKPKVELLKD